MKFLVTGATGFAGPHTINRIMQDGHEVVAMARDMKKCPGIVDAVGQENLHNIQFVKGDLSDLDSITKIFDEHIFDGVFHIGAFANPGESFDTPLLASQTNILGMAHICDQILEKMPECVLMNCSTPEVYGICPGDKKITEAMPLNPNNPYGVSKAGADMYMIERTQTAGLKGFVTRAFSHTGPRRRSNYSISSDAIQIARILRGEQDPVIKIGNMAAQRIVADVRDIAEVYYLLMIEYMKGNVGNGEIFHIAGNDLHTIQYYLDLMLDMTDLSDKVKLEIEPKFFRKVEIPVQIPDDSKVRNLLGWEPKYPIEQTLGDLVDYWLKELDNNGN